MDFDRRKYKRIVAESGFTAVGKKKETAVSGKVKEGQSMMADFYKQGSLYVAMR